MSADLTNAYLKQDDRRLPAEEEYLWMSCFGAHMTALFVALDELLPYVPAASQDFTPYLARARNHAEAIDKAFRFRLAFLRRFNEVKRDVTVDEDVVVDSGVAANEGGWATNSDVDLDYINPNVIPSPGVWFFFGHIAPLHHFQVQHESAAVAFPVPPS
eukprot:jgi/Tetstr1/455400/TSEL_042232.t1